MHNTKGNVPKATKSDTPFVQNKGNVCDSMANENSLFAKHKEIMPKFQKYRFVWKSASYFSHLYLLDHFITLASFLTFHTFPMGRYENERSSKVDHFLTPFHFLILIHVEK